MADLILSQDLVRSFVDSTDQFPVDFDYAWQWLGYSTKQKAKNRLISSFEVGIDYTINLKVKRVEGNKSGGSVQFEEIRLTANCFKELGMLAGTAKGKEVRKYFLECEKIVKQQQSVTSVKLPPYEEAVRIADSIRHITDALDDNPRLAQLLIDHAINEILEQKALPGSTPQFRGVAEIAIEMGFKIDASNRIKLGHFIKNLGFEFKKEKRLCNGVQADINCYPDTPELRAEIARYFE